MLKAFRKMKGKPVTVDFRNEDSMGGGFAGKEPKTVLLLLDVSCLWVALEWEWSGQIVVVPASDVTCIAEDCEARPG